MLKNPKAFRSVKVMRLIYYNKSPHKIFIKHYIILHHRLSISGALVMLINECIPTSDLVSTVRQKLLWAVLMAARPICGPLVITQKHIFVLCTLFILLANMNKGCILAELYTGQPIFSGENETDQLARFIDILGVPPKKVIGQAASRRRIFFGTRNKQ